MKFKILEKRKEFFDSKFINTINNPKIFWNNINTLLYNRNSNKKDTIELTNNSGKILNRNETADYLNEYFINLPQKTIEKEYGDINKINPIPTNNYSNPNSIFLENVDEVEIIDIINNLNNSNSTSVDEINSKVIKECAFILCKILPHYLNQCFISGKFPDCLETAEIIPIYKKCGDKNEAKNYRPISLLNVISKIFEACIYNSIYAFLDKNNFFKNNQFGFIKGSNTTSACITFIDKIQRALNDGKLVCTIFLDVAEAFDCVVRYLLLFKLERIGVRGNALALFDSFINNREQSVFLNDFLSKQKETKFGVAQGSKLGPLLFIVFMNDIFDLKLNGNLQLYADDSSINYMADNIETMHKMINEDLEKICNWFKNNMLVLNGDKTKLLFYNSHRKKIPNLPNIFLNNSKLELVNEIKYLGSELNWNSHINNITKKVQPYIGIFRRIAFICGDNVKKMMY